MKTALLLVAAPLALINASPAMAAVTFGDQTVNNGSVLDNVLIANNQSGNSVLGETNQGNVGVTFTSTQLLETSAAGQAVITAANALLTNLTVFLTDGLGFRNFEVDFQGSASSPQSIFLTTNLGNHEYVDMDGNGANWAGAATDGEYFTSITFNASADGYDNMKQLRLGGIGTPLPEPGTWAMMLIGFGAIGWAMRRKSAVATTARVQYG